jgi:uncharacterized MAPEG superfamily protein
MTTELWLLVAAVLLGFAQIILQAQSMNMQRGFRWNAGPRDEILPPLTGIAGRLNRALRNFLESFPLFAAAVLVAAVANIHNGLTLWGAWLYLLGRIVYVPLYAFGVRYVRSLVWNVAVLGIFLILSGIARGVT